MGLPCHKTISRPRLNDPLMTRTPSDVTPAGGRRVPNTDEEQADRGVSNDIKGTTSRGEPTRVKNEWHSPRSEQHT